MCIFLSVFAVFACISFIHPAHKIPYYIIVSSYISQKKTIFLLCAASHIQAPAAQYVRFPFFFFSFWLCFFFFLNEEMCIFLGILRVFACASFIHPAHTIPHYIIVSSIFRKKNNLFYCAPLHIFRHPQHNSLAHLAHHAIFLYIYGKQGKKRKD